MNLVSASPGYVRVYHPGYNVEKEIFRFAAYSLDLNGTRWINYDFVYDMCMAMTGHLNRGFFTLGKAPNLPKVGREQGVLVEGVKYFFHIGSDTVRTPGMYPVIRDFRDYVFSPRHVGDHWRVAVRSTTGTQGYIPGACILSNVTAYAETAQLMPTKESQYWRDNGLRNYTAQPGRGTRGTSTESNLVRLQPALHQLFDAGYFVLIPINQRLHCQWIRTSDRFVADFHSRGIRGDCHLMSPEYAYLACVYRVMWLMQEELLERRVR